MGIIDDNNRNYLKNITKDYVQVVFINGSYVKTPLNIIIKKNNNLDNLFISLKLIKQHL